MKDEKFCKSCFRWRSMRFFSEPYSNLEAPRSTAAGLAKAGTCDSCWEMLFVTLGGNKMHDKTRIAKTKAGVLQYDKNGKVRTCGTLGARNRAIDKRRRKKYRAGKLPGWMYS